MTTLEEWVAETLGRIQRGDISFDSVHFDELDLPWPEWRQAQQVLLRASSLVPPSWGGRVSVWLPMQETKLMMTSLPPEPELLASRYEPPSLLLDAPMQPVRLLLPEGERFVKGCTLAWGREGVGVKLFSWRTKRDISLDWEFGNGLLIYRFPADSLPPSEDVSSRRVETTP